MLLCYLIYNIIEVKYSFCDFNHGWKKKKTIAFIMLIFFKKKHLRRFNVEIDLALSKTLRVVVFIESDRYLLIKFENCNEST